MNAKKADTLTDRRLMRLVTVAAQQPDVKADIEANHDENRWWPTRITDPRMRMLAAGWSTRISYNMINTYSRVITAADSAGFDQLISMPDGDVAALAQPLGLPAARVGYLRSLTSFVADRDDDYLLHADSATVIADFAGNVAHASYKVAQCALLYARGYHCGIIPVDSGMVTRLAPALGLPLATGPVAHEQMRQRLEAHAAQHRHDYTRILRNQRHAVTVADETIPSWWLHLSLIYFKRRYLNQKHPRVCLRRPVCETVLDCAHSTGPATT